MNITFIPTIKSICRWLNVSFWDTWKDEAYVPTSVGKPWRGTGAYNNRYQTFKYGPLKNDLQKIADKVTGPNIYVTQRWKSRMSKNEIKVIEILFNQEMKDLSYDSVSQLDVNNNISTLIWNLIFPFQGEIPSMRWIINGKNIGLIEILQRLFYTFAFMPFYVLSRIILLRLYCKGFFNNDEIQ